MMKHDNYMAKKTIRLRILYCASAKRLNAPL